MNFPLLKFALIRDVAQSGSVQAWGAWGRKFESCRPDNLKVFYYFQKFILLV